MVPNLPDRVMPFHIIFKAFAGGLVCHHVFLRFNLVILYPDLKHTFMHNILIIATDHPFYQQVIALRQKVLRAPLGLNIYDDDLAAEVEQLIFVFEEGQVVKGCVLMQHYDAGTFKLRQMAVDPDEQGKQIGSRLIEAAELYAIQLGKKKIMLHARQTAMPFYEKLGYTAEGETFYEVGLPHKKMLKILV